MQLGLEADSQRTGVINISSVINATKGRRKTMITTSLGSHGNGPFLIVLI